jgi:hypothetical protein
MEPVARVRAVSTAPTSTAEWARTSEASVRFTRCQMLAPVATKQAR